MSKSPFDPIQIADAADLAIASIKKIESKALWSVDRDVEKCQLHGEYSLTIRDDQGRIWWHPPGCPICRKQAKVARLFEESNIPKRFLFCDFDNYEAVTDEQKRVLRRCQDFAAQFSKNKEAGACLLLCGRPGTGKNHLATAVSKSVLFAGYSVLRIKAAQYLDAFWAKGFDERENWLKGLSTVDLLIFDEVGRSSQAKAAQDAFFRLIDHRYEAQLPNLLTTNLNRDGLIEVLGDASYDRLTQNGGIRLTMEWDSYRCKKG